MIDKVEKNYSVSNEFNTYKVTYENGKVVYVPLDQDNTDYQAIQQWIADGGTVIDNPPE
tara:strand:- start:41 stop:217 length:177 start_codon:yes stop_codon:yes gene_type:complete